MRKLFLLSALALLLCAGLSSCRHDEPEQIAPIPAVEQIDPEYRTILNAWGYDGNDMTAFKEGYIVEGDVFVSKEQLEEAKSRTRQNYYGNANKIDPAYYKIGIDFIGTFKKDKDLWKSAFRDAAAVWSHVDGCAIEFVNSNWTSFIWVEEDANSSRFGMAPMPVNGQPQGWVQVNAGVFARAFPNDYQGNQRRMAAVHLLGHCLGLAHTPKSGSFKGGDFTDEQNAGTGTHIPGTAETEDGSVMVYDAYGNSFNTSLGLTDNDKLAIRTLYPSINMGDHAITGASSVLKSIETTYQLIGLYTTLSPTITWSCSPDKMTIVSGQGTSSVKVKFNEIGNMTLNATVKYTGYNPMNITYQVAVGGFDDITISGPEDTFAGSTESYELLKVPDGVSITWSIASGTGASITSGQGTKKAFIKFNKKEIVTVKAKIAAGTNTKEITRTVYAEGNVDLNKLSFKFTKTYTYTTSPGTGTIGTIGGSTAQPLGQWKIGDTGTCTLVGLENIDQSLIVSSSWNGKGVAIDNSKSNNPVGIKVTDYYYLNGVVTWPCLNSVTYTIFYTSIRGGTKSVSATGTIVVDNRDDIKPLMIEN